mgnify:CR=1 FL=1
MAIFAENRQSHAFNSEILLLSNDTETGLPPKFPPEPKINRSAPITGPTNSRNLFATNDVFIASGRSSPGNKLICNRALELLFNDNMVFSKSCLSDPFKYSSVNSLFTINDFSSIMDIIESVTLTFHPAL